MDPLSTLASIISIIDAIQASYAVIKRIENIPQAFKEVGDNLDFVKTTFDQANKRLRPTALDDDKTKESVTKKLNQCKTNLESLEEVFKKVQNEAVVVGEGVEDGSGPKLKKWADKLIQIYKHVALVATGKDKRVEELMKKVVEGLQDLMRFKIFSEPFKNADIGRLEDVLDALKEVKPSVEADAETGMSIRNEGDNAAFIQSKTSGGKSVNVARNLPGAIANLEVQGNNTNTYHYGSSEQD